MEEHIQLFCLPYAGGNSYFYNELQKNIYTNIELVLLDYPGHGKRVSEELYDNIHDIVDDISREIINKKNEMNFALLGYSFGATICYELFFNLFNKYNLIPKHIFFMANVPPYVSEGEEKKADLPDDKFIESIKEYGGFSKEILDNKELMDFYLPILKADIKAEENKLINIIKPINCDISIIYSSTDDKHGNIDKWKNCAMKECDFYKLEGNHFFMYDNYKNVAEIINNVLSN